MLGKINLNHREKALRQIAGCGDEAKLTAVIRDAADGALRLAALERLKAVDRRVAGQLRYEAFTDASGSFDARSMGDFKAERAYLTRGPLARLAVEYRHDAPIREAALAGIAENMPIALLVLADEKGMGEALKHAGSLTTLQICLYVRCNESREAAMLRLVDQMEDEERLEKIAADHMIAETVRARALERVSDPERLYRIALGGYPNAIRRLSREQAMRLIRGVPADEPIGRRAMAAERIDDEETIVKLLGEAGNPDMQKALVQRIPDPARRCELGWHDDVCVGSTSEHIGDTVYEYDIYECKHCKRRYKKETGSWW